MARVVNAQYATVIGTAQQVQEFFAMLQGMKSAVVNMDYSNIVLLHEPISDERLATALQTTPRKAGKT